MKYKIIMKIMGYMHWIHITGILNGLNLSLSFIHVVISA